MAAQVHSENTSLSDSRSYVATATGATTLHLPAAYKNQWNTNSGVVVQNLGSSAAYATIYFYDRATGNHVHTESLYLHPKQADGLWAPGIAGLPDNWAGSMRVTSSQPLAAIAQVGDDEDIYAYTAATGFVGSTIVLPRAAKNASGRTTGYIVLNPSDSSSVNVTATYYNTAGGVSHVSSYSLPRRGAAGYHQSLDPMSNGWQGSILLQADGDIIALMREDDTGNDGASAYNGAVR